MGFRKGNIKKVTQSITLSPHGFEKITKALAYSKKIYSWLFFAIVKGFKVKDLPTQCKKKVSKTFGDFLASPYKISRGTFYILISVYCQSTNFLAEHLIWKQVILQNFRAKFCTQMRQTRAVVGKLCLLAIQFSSMKVASLRGSHVGIVGPRQAYTDVSYVMEFLA